ncbi:hypothetical protein Riv7116_5354 [Rivularia sp. PCC 7116]|uniref:hypothetical protein n=1 Tax=Rivularia sp. PCC 7116 TaxID=373994 RepID=UPI00029F44CD|nr:hypothetical protein [Rivularia sp. PCC 7116]AFY57734.1 hypothetical protein Riv7116_5354 [Rivularia sp. PCC 7116]
MLTIQAYDTSDIEAVIKLWWKTWHNTFPEIRQNVVSGATIKDIVAIVKSPDCKLIRNH